MKKIFLLLLLILWMNTSVSANSAVDQISSLESGTTLASDDIYMINYYYDLLKWVSASCSAPDINTAKNYSSSIIKSLDTKYAGMSIGDQLHESRKLHDKLLSFQFTLNRIWWEHYCSLKYILYTVQSHLRDYHVWIMKNTWIIRDFDGFVLWGAIHGEAAKLEILDSYIAKLQPYELQLWETIDFIDGDSVTSDDDAWVKVSEKNKKIMQLTVYKAMTELRNAGLLTEADVQELKDKFVLDLRLSCDSFHGNYRVTETFDHTGEHIKFSTDEVPLDVNVCWNYFLLKELPEHFYKIVIHELGHHFYYYRDRVWHENFENICWSWSQCTANDFVSDYAKTSAIEDYADHFMHRFLKLPVPQSAIIDRKNQHFNAFR